MTNNQSEIIGKISSYYADKLALYGASSKGVDWNGEEGQVLRFKQLAKIISQDAEFSLNDLGCGYGAMYDFLLGYKNMTKYNGYDISPEMIAAANAKYQNCNVEFKVASRPDNVASYSVASGIFNVRLNCTNEEWSDHVIRTLDTLDTTSELGFAANFLTTYSDESKKKNYLYYANPMKIFEHCKSNYSKNVAVLHDYDLYEFTILVRKRA